MQIAQEPVAQAFFQIPTTDEARPILQTLLSKLQLRFQVSRKSYPRTTTVTSQQNGISTKEALKSLPPLDPVVSDRTIHAVVMVIDRESLLAIQANLDKRHIPLWKPETADLLVLTHKIGSVDPERKLLCGMSFDPDNRIVIDVNPHLSLKQIFVFP